MPHTTPNATPLHDTEHDQFATAAPPSSNEHEKNSSEKNSTEMTPVKEKGSDEDEADVAPATPGL